MNRLTPEACRRIAWDYRPLEHTAQAIIDEPGLTDQKIQVYRKLLMSVRWYDLLDMLSREQLHEALSEPVLKILWPAGVKRIFTYAASLLRAGALPIAG